MMHSLKKTIARYHYVLYGVVALTALSHYFGTEEPVSPPAQKAEVGAENAAVRFGPGVFTQHADAEINAPATYGSGGEGVEGFDVDGDNRLLINKELRNAIERVVLDGPLDKRRERVATLHARLQAKLPPAAFSEASRLVANYLSYIGEMERMTVNDGNVGGGVDLRARTVDEVRAWATHRKHLRQSVFGATVAKIWFAEDEREIERAIAALAESRAHANGVLMKPADSQ